MRLLDSLLARLSFDVEGDEDLAAKIRAYQIDSVAKVTPLMMAANVINAGIIVAYIYPQSGSVFLLCWGALIASFAAYSLFHRHRYRRRFPVVRASRRGIGRVIRNALILGAAWGLLPAIAYPGADTGARVMITAAVAGMLGGGSLVMYVVPPAMYAWIGAICAGTAYALVRSGEPGDLATALLVCMFVIALARSGSAEKKRAALAPSLAAALRTVHMLPGRVPVERISGYGEIGFFRQGDGQVFHRHGNDPAFIAMDRRDGTAPIALARNAPVAQAPLRDALA